jgi:DNA-binding phage protein
MGKIKISKKRRRSPERSGKLGLSKVQGLTRANPLKELIDPEKTGLAILECLQNNDPEGVMEMIAIYLDALNKAQLRQQNKLPKSTMYSALKHRNPTIKTLAKIMHASTH